MTERKTLFLLSTVFVYSLFISVSLQTGLLIVFLFCVVFFYRDKQFIFKNRVLNLLILFWFFASLISLFSPYPWTAVKKASTSILFDISIPFAIGLLSSTFEKDIKKHAFYSFMIFAGIALLFYALSLSFLPHFNKKGILNGFLGGKLTYAGVISSFSSVLIEKLSQNTIAGASGLLILALSLVANTSRSYMLGFIVSSTGLLIVRFKKYYRVFILFLPVILAGIYIFPKTRAILKTTTPHDPDKSIRIRLSWWTMGLKIAQKHPLTGIGFETWPLLSEKLIYEYGDTLLLNTLKHGGENARAVKGHLHNTYLQLLINGGIPLLVFYIYLIFIIVKEALLLEENKKIAFLFMFILFLVAGFFEYNLSDAEVAHSIFFFSGLYLKRSTG